MKRDIGIFDGVAFWVLVVTTTLLPLFFLPSSIIGLVQAKLALFGLGTLIALICFLIERVRQGSFSVTLNPVYAFFILIPLAYLASALVSTNFHKSLIGGAFDMDTVHAVSLLMIFCFLVATLARSPKRAGIITLSFISSILLTGLLQIVRIFAGDVFSFGVLSSSAITLVGRFNDLVLLSVIFLGALLIVLETIRFKQWVKVGLTLLMILPFLFLTLSSVTFDFYFFSIPISMFVGILALVIFIVVCMVIDYIIKQGGSLIHK